MMLNEQGLNKNHFYRFSGYASIFNKPDIAGDIILPNAFNNTLKRDNLHDIKMLYQHDTSCLLGKWIRFTQDAKGLYVTGDIVMSTMIGKEVSILIQEKIINGLSIGFRTKYSNYGQTKSQRFISELDLIEISLVTFPMQTDAILCQSA